MRMRHPLCSLLGLIVAAVLAGCGGDAAGDMASTATPAPMATGTAAAAGDAGGPVASTAATPREALPLVRFTTTAGGSVTLPVEVIAKAEFSTGLSGRTSLDGRGMLFYWPDGDGESGFWMKDTLIPLDIAFIDRDLRIIAILQMEAESLEIHRAPAPYLAAVEAPLGWYAEHGVAAGAAVEWLFDPDALGAGR